MKFITSLFNKTTKPKEVIEPKETQILKTKEDVAVRKGVLGEYKIDIQLSQLPKNYRYINDIFIKNPKSITGYSQIDHVLLTPYAIFVIETKNYQGTIYGHKGQKNWLINGKFKMLSPLVQNFGHIESLKRIIHKEYHELFISLVSFTKRCTLKIDTDLRHISSNELVIYDIELFDYINRKVAVLRIQNTEPLLNNGDIDSLYQSLLKENIKDANARQNHNKALSQNKNTTNPSENEPGKCCVCNKLVSEKVKKFCFSNPKFKGKIYCYEHQKKI
ncbi:nuclease-related domain-containing protein [Peribacillus glennii]|uniref:NERD domain-containing protein n=1 Tax=Peribacillus glennii TaxID=2303991 RepID=A0A372L6T2_9BACI|nr:nuclease-related domain-containing protein [Peribacillus glennii]RFU60786.1 NERD domain-containing protein [Peribacillus glennii]